MRERNLAESGLTRYQNYLKLLQARIEQREDVKLYLELLLTLAAVSFFTWFAIRPTFSTIVTLVKQINSQEEVASRLDRKLANLERANTQKLQFEEDLVLINQALPDGELPTSAARQLASLAAREGVTLTDISIAKAGERETEQQLLLLSANISGDPQKAISFVGQAGKLRRPLLWETLSLTGNPPGASTVLKISLTARIPFFPKEEGGGRE